MPDSVGTAYLTLVPKLQSGWQGSVNAGLASGIDGNSAGTKAGNGFKLGFGNVLSTIAGLAVVQQAASAIAETFTAAFNDYASYEQLTGGVETLFKDSAGIVEDYAANAYQTAGMSANEYMDTVTSFSASLISGLGGDTDAAAQVANTAITDMADNANKMGTDIESIQNAYQGFAKQNYTMLDNLKLGYGGTQSEMIRLINDSGVLDEEISSLDGISFDTMISAIHQVQENMGITGTTSEEAASTVEGSMNSMKSAWDNFLTSLGTGDVSGTLQPLIDSAYNFLVNNAMPLVGNIMTTVGGLITTYAPVVLTGISSLLSQAAEWIMANSSTIGMTVGNLVTDAASMLLSNAPAILGALLSVGASVLATVGIALAEVVVNVGNCVGDAVDAVAGAAGQFISAGGDVINGLIEGIQNGAGSVISTIENICSGALDAVKSFFGIASPSKVMRSMGGYIGEGMALGISDSEDAITSAWDGATSGIIDRSATLTAKGSGVLGGGNTYIINGLEWTNNARIESAMETIFGQWQRLGAM